MTRVLAWRSAVVLDLEVSMGPAQGGVPGQNSSPDLPYTKTTANDHNGQAADPDAVCAPAEEFAIDWLERQVPTEPNAEPLEPRWADVDTQCLEEKIELGNPGGPWTPLFNDCHDWVQDALDGCTPEIVEEKEREAEKWDGIGEAAWGGA